MAQRLIRLPEVKRITSRSRSSIYAGMRDDTFPKSIALNCNGRGAVAWIEDEVIEWVLGRIASTRQSQASLANSGEDNND